MRNKPLMQAMKKIMLYTDGACSGNPGPGGWGAILRYNGHEKELSGFDPDTTNNRMELSAVIEGVKSLKEPCAVTIVTDSKYVMQGITEWVETWQRNNWRTSQKKDVKNRDLWEALLEVLKPHTITWEWVKGHAGHPENERADTLAVAAIKENR